MGESTVPDAAEGGTGAVFELGLTLSGAISAGAYTAGVLDFLFQALECWDQERECGRADTPSHRVVIKVITGASAGAITGALGAVALARGLHPVGFSDAERAGCYPAATPQDQPFRCVLPALWRTWVELPDMRPLEGEHTGLLGVADLAATRTVASVLDATVLDRIAKGAIEAPGGPKGPSGPKEPRGPEETPIQDPRPYVAGPLHLYMTLSNMRGIPYRVEFGGAENSYGMMTHGDRVHYVIDGLGRGGQAPADGTEPSWLEEDSAGAALRLSVATLPTREGAPIPPDWDVLGTAALASAAFPVGLAPRALRFPLSHYMERRLPIDLALHAFVKPDFESAVSAEGFAFQTVDGGVVNTSPFDYAQYALFGRAPHADDRRGKRRAIIMVAPFPEPPKLPPDGQPAGTLTAILAALFPALINQARFRTSELAPAVDTRDYSRFLVAPKRRIPSDGPDTPSQERFTIASGLLGGFGGFLGRAFRAHDFQLGRRNCQQFLLTTFAVPPGEVVQGVAVEGGTEIPVIPLFGDAAKTVPLPRWPQIDPGDVDKLRQGINQRLRRLVPALVTAQVSTFYLRLALWTGWNVFLCRPVARFALETMLADLVRRRQLSGYEPPREIVDAAARHGLGPDDAAAVMGMLFLPAADPLPTDRIAKAVALTPDAVEAMLTALSGATVAPTVRCWRGDRGWTLWTRRPGLLARQKPVQRLLDRFQRPLA